MRIINRGNAFAKHQGEYLQVFSEITSSDRHFIVLFFDNKLFDGGIEFRRVKELNTIKSN